MLPHISSRSLHARKSIQPIVYRKRTQGNISTWQLAAGGLRRKWQGIKQRTAWRYKTMKDKNTIVVFSINEQQMQEFQVKPRNLLVNDPLACHNVLQTVSSENLNGIISATSPDLSNQFCTSMMDFILQSSAPKVRELVLKVVTKDRLHEITIANRAIIIKSIQRCLLSPLHVEKGLMITAACDIILGTKGLELSYLKEYIHTRDEPTEEQRESIHAMLQDTGLPDTKYRFSRALRTFTKNLWVKKEWIEPPPLPHSGDLSRLLFSKLNTTNSLTQVVQVMQHIAIEALIVKEKYPGLIKVVSDIDDTLYPGWLDNRYPLHILYPGVGHLYNIVSNGLPRQGHKEMDVSHEDLLSTITFLTARPRGWLNVGAYLTLEHINALGIRNSTVLNGTVSGLVSNKQIAAVKLENFKRLASIFPEFQMIFFGDAGQGDALLASQLLKQFPDQVPCVFIHDFNPSILKTGDGEFKETYKKQGIHFFNSYIDAGRLAYEEELITYNEVMELQDACMKELNEISFTGPKATEMKAQRYEELMSDKNTLEQLIRTIVQADTIIPNSKQSLFGVTNLNTPLGCYSSAILREQDVQYIELQCPISIISNNHINKT